QPKIIPQSKHFDINIERLAYQLIANNDYFSKTVLIGLRPREVFLLYRLVKELENILKDKKIISGELDITFFRDDFRLKPLTPQATKIDFVIDGKQVILIDDVLFTGRSIRAALKAVQSFGRADKIELLVLV